MLSIQGGDDLRCRLSKEPLILLVRWLSLAGSVEGDHHQLIADANETDGVPNRIGLTRSVPLAVAYG
jgi:hypothetical protein